MNKIECCWGCIPPKRRVGCHATCPEYIMERAELDRKNAEKAKVRNVIEGIKEQKEVVIGRAIKQRRNRNQHRGRG